MGIILSHPTGNSNVRAMLTGLAESNNLIEFDTTFSADPNTFWLKLLPQALKGECLRRSFPIKQNQIKNYPYLELSRIILTHLGLKYFIRDEVGYASIDAVYHNLDWFVAKRLKNLVKSNKVSAVYAYEDGALATFKEAKKIGLKCIYDLPIAYWETVRLLLSEEAERLPNWEQTLGGGITDSPAKLDRKVEELDLADVVVGPSQFVLDSLPNWAAGKSKIMSPFGSPNSHGSINPNNNASNKRPLRVLFVGSMGQRKGLGDLFAAIKLLNDSSIELVVMGTPLVSFDFYRKELSNFTFERGRPHQDVLKLMRSCDVLCLPSIIEGRALVMQEAMSQGLPIIITPNTGGSDLICEGQTGFLIPIRSPEAIAEKINWFADNRSEVIRMGLAAREYASQYTWNHYSMKIVKGCSEILQLENSQS
jgi:glycosyltransferase involved in cell wall biosynthesis